MESNVKKKALRADPIKNDKNAEQQSTHFLRSIIDTVLDPIFVKDRQHRWIEGNKAFWDLLGGEEKAKGKTDYDFFPKEISDQFWAGDERVFSGEVFDEEEKILTPEGKELNIATKKTAFTMSNGEPGLVGVIRDVTEQRKIEIEMRQNRDRLAELVEERTSDLERQRRLYETALSNSPDFIYIFDLQCRFRYVNDPLLKMYGKTWDETIGKPLLEIGYEPWLAERHAGEIEQIVKTRMPIQGEVPFSGTHGTRIYDYIFVPVIGKNGEVEAVAGTTRDVTERQEIEKTIRKSEERQRLALEASHSFGIWDWDIVNNIFTADERFGALFGLTAEEATSGVTLEYVAKAIHPEDKARVMTAVNKVLEKGGRYHEEYRVIQGNGETRWVSVRGHVQFDEQGCATRFPGAGLDVTREREAMEALRTSNQKKDEFLATLAHELRNPLAPLRNSVYLFKSENLNAERKQQAYDIFERQVEQMVRLVDDLMDVSRINTGKIELRKESIFLEDVLNQAIENAQPLIKEYNHKLEMVMPTVSIYLDGDMVRLSQIFANLINNSAKYTNPGGKIVIKAATENKYAVIKVTDNGVGISKETLPYIFDMFSQADNSIEKACGGLGIGLTITKKLVELHGGSIQVESEGIGQGSIFTVKIPTAKSTPAVQKIVNETRNEISALKVLIVDDNHASAQTLAWAVELLNHQTCVCHDGKQAIEMAKALKPDAILLDIGMPGMNGYEICKKMKIMPELKNSIFIAQTGWGQKEHREKSREAGFDHHLVKPVDLTVLDEILKIINKNE